MTGVIVSNKMTKAVKVKVVDTKVHPKYGKRYKSIKKYAASCENSQDFMIGQTVKIVETKPKSRSIKWKVLS